jgi:hypothetical protein
LRLLVKPGERRTYIGWLERTLFFTFILAGQPRAAAIALAAKCRACLGMSAL